MGSSISGTINRARLLYFSKNLGFARRLLLFAALLPAAVSVSAAAETGHCPVAGDIVIAAEDAFFPYSGLYQGKLHGFAVDIVSAAFKEVDCTVSFRVMPYNRCIREVAQGRQLGCFDTTGSAENRRNFIFHQVPLFNGKILIYAHPENVTPFHSKLFNEKTFSVVRGYTYTDRFDASPGISKIEVDSDLQTLALVAMRRADYAVVYEKVAAFHTSNSAKIISPAPRPVQELARFDLYVSFSKETPDRSSAVAELLDRGLDTIRKDGTYAAIEKTWDDWLTVGLTFGRPAPSWMNTKNGR